MTGAEAILALQASAGNQAVARALAARNGRTLARCAGRCTCGGSCGKEEQLEDERKPRPVVATKRGVADPFSLRRPL